MMREGMKDCSYNYGEALESAQKFNREFLKRRAIDSRTREISNLEKKIDNLKSQNTEEGCEFCKDLTYENRLYDDAPRLFGLRSYDDKIQCPICQEILVHW